MGHISQKYPGVSMLSETLPEMKTYKEEEKLREGEREDLDGIMSSWNSLVKQTQFLWLPSS